MFMGTLPFACSVQYQILFKIGQQLTQGNRRSFKNLVNNKKYSATKENKVE